MATDSRWSIQHGNWLFYLDDTGYDKIERMNGMALMFAGYGAKIQEYKYWLRSNPADDSNMPDVKGMSVCMVEESTGIVEVKEEQEIDESNVLCAGSGAWPAYRCWQANKSPLRAVDSAKMVDICSGGEVKFIDFPNSKTNVVSVHGAADLTIQVISENIFKRGIPMKLHTTQQNALNMPFSKVAGGAANDEHAAREEIGALIASGELSANAPCAGMNNDWSDASKANFKRALGKMFGWKP